MNGSEAPSGSTAPLAPRAGSAEPKAPPARSVAPGAPLVLGVAAAAGTATMVVELAAVRLIAPWFGSSQTVWTNVIGVVLLALSLGYLAGARLSRREAPGPALAVALLLASASAAWLPALAPLVARTFLPEGLALDEVAGLLSWGSLATAVVLFLPPAFLLGCVSPLCTELVDRGRPQGAGSASGRVACLATLGSLAGTFATTFVLVPELGLSRTFLAAAGVLGLLGLAVAWTARTGRARPMVALAVAPLAALAAGEMERPALAGDAVLLEAAESPYQSVRVVRFGTPGPSEQRHLQVNEAFDSFQSVWIPRTGLIGHGCYYDAFALPPWWGRRPGTWRLCVLGLGAGTTWRVLEGALPEDVQLDAVGAEIDPRVVELAERWMDLRAGPERRVLAGWDARAALAHAGETFDQIVLDAYSNQMEIPPHLCTREFFELAAERLAPGGFLCANVGAFGLDDPVLEAVAASLAAGFDRSVLALQVPFSRNAVLFARKDAPLPDPAGADFVPPDPRVAPLARMLALPGTARTFAPGSGRVLTDDRCDIERLQMRSLERRERDREGPGR